MTGNYWQMCVEEVLSEHGVAATAEQVAAIARDIEGCASVECEATGRDRIPDPREAEIKRVSDALRVERSKQGCPDCRGRGRITIEFLPGRFSNSDCETCHGEGKVLP